MNEKNAGIPMRWRENESMLIDSLLTFEKL